MTTGLLIAVVLAALACPAHMFWRMRQGRRGCCGEALGGDAAVESLRRRQEALRASVRRFDAGSEPRRSQG